MVKDYHSLWVNSAALALADADLQVPGGVVERDEHGEPTGVLREESPGTSATRYVRPTEDEMVDASRAAIPLAPPAESWPSTTRTAGSAPCGSSSACRTKARSSCASGSRSRGTTSTGSRRSALLRPGRRLPARRLHQGASSTGRSARARRCMLDGTGVEIVGYEEFVDIVRRSAARRLSRRGARDRRPRQPARPRRLRGDAGRMAAQGPRQRIEHAQLLTPEDVAALRGARRRRAPCSSATRLRPRPRRPLLGRQDRGRVRLPLAARLRRAVANGSDAPVEELDPLFGIAPACPARSTSAPAWRPEQAVTVEQALHATCVAPAWLTGDERRRGKLLPGYARRPRRARPRPARRPARGAARRSRSSPRWSAAAGCTTRLPGADRAPTPPGLQCAHAHDETRP